MGDPRPGQEIVPRSCRPAAPDRGPISEEPADPEGRVARVDLEEEDRWAAQAGEDSRVGHPAVMWVNSLEWIVLAPEWPVVSRVARSAARLAVESATEVVLVVSAAREALETPADREELVSPEDRVV